jgi:hypothetical protein
VALAAYMAIVGGALAAFGDRPLVVGAIMLPATLMLVLIAARTTRGGWRWRWGKED